MLVVFGSDVLFRFFLCASFLSQLSRNLVSATVCVLSTKEEKTFAESRQIIDERFSIVPLLFPKDLFPSFFTDP
jgi:hypothetical protein